MSRSGITRERLIGLFLLGLFLLSPTVLSLVDQHEDVLIGGIPFLLVYLFVVWAGLILASALFVFYRQRQIGKLRAPVENVKERG